MTRSEREYLAKRIVQHYVNTSDRQKKITVNHFLQERIQGPTIYRIIKKFEESGVIGNKLRRGRLDKLSKQQFIRLKRLTDQKTGISLRKIAPKFDVDISTISRHLKAMGITYRKKNGRLNTLTNNLKKCQHVLDDGTEHCQMVILNW